MNTPHLWLAACMLFIASTSNTLLSQTADAISAPVLVQLDFPLSQSTQTQLRAEGIELVYHYGQGVYLVSHASSELQTINADQLQQPQASVLKQFETENQTVSDERIDVDLVFAFADAPTYLTQVLAEAGFEATTAQIENGRTLSGSVPTSALAELLAHPYLLDATPSLTELVPYNLEARIVQSVTPLNSGIAGAANLNGRGIVLGVGDGGQLAGHPDMGERILYSTSNYNSGWGNHPDMVSGIMVGAGNVFAANRGVASEAELIVETNSAITYHAPTYLEQYGMTITNNSYGPSFSCNTANRYYGNSASMDQQLFDNPSLLHVFAVGNSGTNRCTDLPTGYASIPGGPQNAKNTLSVGNVKFDRERYRTSSAGPTKDGRLKPEISAVGTTITTTVRNGGYGSGTGTSFAAPNVASTLGLLSEAFQRNNPGTVPQGALLKAVACNTADDAGREGPDFEYGFGIMNALNALEVINADQFEMGTITTDEEVTRTITVESGATELKVMLYWNDVAGSTNNVGSVLVNDLELVLVSANGEQTFPLVLDANNPTRDAQPGEDHLNNIEQVTIKNPSAGNYTVIVRATNLSYGTGDFVLTWFAPQPAVVITCPFGGEKIIPGQSTYIAWSATTADQGTWTVEYAVDGGQWAVLQDNIAGEERSINWAAPVDINQVEFRITNSETNTSDVTNAPVSVVAPPANLTSVELCATSLVFSWSPTEEAARYAVYQFDGEQMQMVGATTDTVWTFEGIQQDEQLILSVAAITEANQTSKRAYAYEVTHAGLEPACEITTVVEWGGLSTEELGAAVRVKWEVTEEKRTVRFELQRGLLQGATINWTFVDSVKAKGSSNTLISYTLDDQGAAAQGVTYYRVRMIDEDGLDSFSAEFDHERSSTSSTQTAGGQEESTFTLIQNPVRESIRVTSTESKPQTLHLYDAVGRKQVSFQVEAGANQFAWPTGLDSGMYILRAADNASSKAIKLIRR